jgi:endonuclease G
MKQVKNLSNYLVLLLGIGLIIYGYYNRDLIPISTNKKYSASNCPHLPEGKPKGTPDSNDFICRDIYALSSNQTTKFADYVAYCLDKKSVSGNNRQERQWQADPDLDPRVTLEPEDYRNGSQLGYDRGHQAPLANFRQGNWAQTNYLSNITPQKAQLNQGPWLGLEKHERQLVKKHGKICVITGPYYLKNQNMPKLPNADEPHVVPNGYWKIITYKGIREAYQYPQNTAKNSDFRRGKTTVLSIESISHLKFFSQGSDY